VRVVIAETLGTMVLVIIGCGSALNKDWASPFDVTQVSLAFGLSVMAMASAIGHISGGHLNPAVSIGLLAGGELPLVDCLVYTVSQCIGAVLGSSILYGVTPTSRLGTLGANGIGEVSPGAAVLLEAILTMVLVLVVYSSAVDPSHPWAPGLAPLTIGLTVTAAHLVLIPYTGTSVNPARSLGPALVGNHWKDHWVFWVGPITGGVVGGILYNTVFRIRSSNVDPVLP